MTPLQRAAAIAAAFLVVLGALVLLARATGAPIGIGPTPELTPTTEPTRSFEPTASPSASATPVASSDELAIFAQIEAEVEDVRRLPPAGIGPPQLLGRTELVAELRRLFDEDYPAEERRADNITLRAMGLLGEGQDAAELQLQLLGDQVLGFYDDTDQRMVVVSDVGVDAAAKFTYAHEYTHALQYAAFPVTEREDAVQDDDDATLALTALIEGDATLSMASWAFAGGLTPSELLEIQETPFPDTTGIPDWMVKTLEFPYSDGFAWVVEVAGNPLSPNFAAVDDAFGEPPSSTEQIIHIDKWLERERPMPVAVADLATALGAGWNQVESTTIGEAFVAIYLQQFGIVPLDAQAAATGWGGDRLVAAAGPDDAFVMAWVLAWDAPADADEYVAAWNQGVPGSLGFPARLTPLSAAEVLIVHASDQQLLEAAEAAVLAAR